MNIKRTIPAACLALRVAAGMMFFQAAAVKLFAWFVGAAAITP